MIYNDRLYTLDSGSIEEKIFSCKIKNDSENPEKIKRGRWPTHKIPKWTNLALPYRVRSLSGEFWLVMRRSGNGIEAFQVFKFDVGENKWMRLHDLGKQALVITEMPHCAVSLASRISATSF